MDRRRRQVRAVADLDDGRALTMHFGMSGVDGSEGKFVLKLRIYGRKTCPDCGTPVAKVVLGGRTSWYCSKCQK